MRGNTSLSEKAGTLEVKGLCISVFHLISKEAFSEHSAGGGAGSAATLRGSRPGGQRPPLQPDGYSGRAQRPPRAVSWL